MNGTEICEDGFCPFVLSCCDHTLRYLFVFFLVAFLFPSAVPSALIDPGRHVVVRQGIHAFGFFRKFSEIPAYLLVGYFRINLCSTYAGMPHHFTDGLNWHAVGKADFSRIGVSAHVIGQVAPQARTFPR